MGKPRTLAAAVVTALNATTFSPTITFTKTLVPVLTSEGQQREGKVFLSTKTFSKLNRCSDYEETVDVAVLVVSPVTNTAGLPTEASLDTLVDLCDSIIDYMKTIGKLDGYHLVEIEQSEEFDFGRVYEESIFETTITLRFRGY